MPKNPKAKSEYKCVCNKVFKHASSLWNHKQKCGLIKQENETISVDGVNGPEIILGSMSNVSVNGNWPTIFDTSVK